MAHQASANEKTQMVCLRSLPASLAHATGNAVAEFARIRTMNVTSLNSGEFSYIGGPPYGILAVSLE